MREVFGIRDAVPVVCEPFTQWVLQDVFPAAGRPGSGPACPGPRRRALRADEAAPAERGPPGDGLRRVPGGLPVRARGRGRPGLHRVPAWLHAAGGPADGARRPRHRPRRVHPHAAAAFRQSGHPRHARPPGRLRLRPDSQVAGARDPAEPGQRGRSHPVGGGRGQLGPLRRGNGRVWPADRRGGRGAGRADGQCAAAGRRPAGVRAQRQLFGDIAGQPAFVSPYLLALESFHEHGSRRTIEQINETLRFGS